MQNIYLQKWFGSVRERYLRWCCWRVELCLQ